MMSTEVTTPGKGKKILTTVVKVLRAIAQVGAGILLLKKSGAIKTGAGVDKAAEIAGVAATVAEAIGSSVNE